MQISEYRTISSRRLFKLALAALLGLAALLVPAPRQPTIARAAARAAGVVNVTDTAHLHMVGESGSLIAEEGSATGQLPGTVKARFDIGATVTAYYTIYASSGGSITGHGRATLHSSGRYATFGGTLLISHGTGRFAHAHGSGGLYGAIDRHTYAVTVQTTGRLSY